MGIKMTEQDSIEVKPFILEEKDEWWGFVIMCPACEREWMGNHTITHFCPYCGIPIKWDKS